MGVSVPRLVSRPVTFQKLPLSTHQRCTLGSGELDQRAVRQGGSGTWDGCTMSDGHRRTSEFP